MSNCSGNNPSTGSNSNRRKGYYYRREIQPFEPDFTGNFWDISGTSIYNTNGCGEGFVGIGNSNPQYNLDVSGIVNVSNRIITYGISAEYAEPQYIVDVTGSIGFPSASTLVLGSTPNGIKWVDVSAGGGGGSLPAATEWSEYLYYNPTIAPSGAYQSGGGSGDNNRLHLGSGSGQGSQGSGAIALGYQTGQTQQGSAAIAIGIQAGRSNQGINAIAIGYQAGISGEKSGAIALGYQAGAYNQGTNSIAIGNFAGRTNQRTNSIIINATGTDLSSIDISGLYIAPIRLGREDFILSYNTNSKEVRYTQDISLNNLDISNRLRVNDISANKGWFRDLSSINLQSTNAIINDLSATKIWTQDISAVNLQVSGITRIGDISVNNIDGSFNIIDTNDTNMYYPIFAQGSGYQRLRIDTNKLIYNPGLDRLGINRDPSYNLDVNGSFRATTIIDRNLLTGNNGQVLTSTATGIEWKDISSGGGGGTNYWSLTTNGLDIYNNNSSNNGNVGIGTGNTASIPYKLDVSGETRIQTDNIRYGRRAGNTNMGSYSIAIGYEAGLAGEQSGAIAIGYQAGYTNMGVNSIAIGSLAGRTNQASNSILINASGVDLSNVAVSGLFIAPIRASEQQNLIYYNTLSKEITYQDTNNFAPSKFKAYSLNETNPDISMSTATKFYPVLVDGSGTVIAYIDNRDFVFDASRNRLGIGIADPSYNLDISGTAKITNQLLVGNVTTSSLTFDVVGDTRIQSDNIRFGTTAGNTSQGSYAIAIGFNAGAYTQLTGAVSIGVNTGQTAQGANAVAIGASAGQATQGGHSVAIGYLAGQTRQGEHAVAIGREAGAFEQGTYSIAIGYYAGRTGQFQNSIVLNATNIDLNSSANGLFIAPIRATTPTMAISKALYYDTTTNEVLYGDISGGGGGGTNYWTLTGNDIYNNNSGNVGIGTTSSIVYKLDVSGETRIQSTNIRYGVQAGQTNQSLYGIAVGFQAGRTNQQTSAIAIGYQAGQGTQGTNAVAIGVNAGISGEQSGAIAIGFQAGQTFQGTNSIAIGVNAGLASQGVDAVSIGDNAGQTNQNTGAIAIGSQAGQGTQGTNAIAIGVNAGSIIQRGNSVAIGNSAGQNTQGSASIAVGFIAGQNAQGSSAIAIGNSAGMDTQGTNAVAIGVSAGHTVQGQSGIGIGVQAGGFYQQSGGIAIGFQAGRSTQGINALSFGNGSGQTQQGSGAIAIGLQAGQETQGTNSIAIGNLAGRTNQTANSIIINATGLDLSSMDVSGLFIAPVRRVNGITQALYYNTSTSEIVYGDISSSGGGGGTNFWTSSGSNLYNNTGSNIGINTTSPAFNLDISGSVRLTNDLKIGNSTTITKVINNVDGSMNIVNTCINPSVTDVYFTFRPDNSNVQIDISFANWGTNNVLSILDIKSAGRSTTQPRGCVILSGQIYADNSGSNQFDNFINVGLTRKDCSLTTSSPGPYTLRLTIDPTYQTDIYSGSINIINATSSTDITAVSIRKV